MIRKIKNKNIIISVAAGLAVAAVVLGFLFLKQDKSIIVSSETGYMAKNIRNSFKSSPGYWGLDTKFVIDNNLTNNIIDGKISNVFGKEVKIGYGFESTKLMPGSRTFDIIYTELNRNECIDAITAEFDEEQRLSLISIIIRAEDKIDEFGWGREENKLPVSINIAKRFCKNKNDILWRFE